MKSICFEIFKLFRCLNWRLCPKVGHRKSILVWQGRTPRGVTYVHETRSYSFSSIRCISWPPQPKVPLICAYRVQYDDSSSRRGARTDPLLRDVFIRGLMLENGHERLHEKAMIQPSRFVRVGGAHGRVTARERWNPTRVDTIGQWSD